MKEKYPFFEYIWKTEEQKGHVNSMNIIVHQIKEYNYCIHMEDDFHFIERRKYVTDAINIIKDDPIIGQVQFNRNYAEIEPFRQRIIC